MKKTRKRILFVLMVAIVSVISLMAVQVTAGSGLALEDVDFEYVGMSTEQAEQIIRAMFGIRDGYIVQPRSIACIFGHNISTGAIITTHHRAFSTNPRCSMVTSYVEYCTRSSCGHFVIVRENTTRIGCC